MHLNYWQLKFTATFSETKCEQLEAEASRMAAANSLSEPKASSNFAPGGEL
jgi:hypothetical protein